MGKNKDIKERSYNYAVNIIKFIELMNKDNLSSQIIARQLIRSATSIGANIIEAQAGPTKKDFTNFINHALKSANESIFWLKLTIDCDKANNEETTILLKETQELANILASSILTLRGKRKNI